MSELKRSAKQKESQSESWSRIWNSDAETLEAMRALSKMDISGIYNDLAREERRRFWRGIISTIWVGKDRSIKVEFVMLSSCTK